MTQEQTLRSATHVAGALALGLLAPAAASAAGTLTACMQDAPEGLDVVQFETSATLNAVGMTVFDQLLRMAPGGTELRPGLAQRWDTSADGRTLTLQLRRGVKFHSTPWFKPTRELNADDVVASLERLRDKAHPWHGLSAGGYLYWQSMGLHKLVLETAKVDSHTVRIRLARPEASFASTLTMPAIGSIYSAEYVNGLIKQGQSAMLNVQPVGSGPYIFRSMRQGSLIRFDANAAHWAGTPPVDKLIMPFVPEAAVTAQKLRVGECQFGELPRVEAAKVEADPALQVLRHQPLVTTYVWINTTAAGLGETRLRQALRLAIDRQAVVQAAYAGDALATANLLPPGVAGHDPTLTPAPPPDPVRASELIKAMGAAPREFTLFITNANSVRRAAEVMQADWARIGVKVNIRAMDLAELYRRTAAGEHDLALASWTGDNGDADNFFSPLVSCDAVKSGGNKSRLCDPALEALIEQARSETKPERRADLYRQANRRLIETSGLIPLTHPAERVTLSRRVQGFVPSPLGLIDFSTVRLTDPPK